MSELSLFLPITKVDADQRIVYGIATAEVADRAGEICDYDSTKPYYEAWSAEMNEASGGKSLGALRAMHGRVAAGKITDIAFDDAGKRIMIAAKIVDDDEWRKVEEGVYTGFSQGGRYVRRWSDPGGELTRYTAEPREISLVDLPCVASATFEVIKDGIAQKRAFAAAAKNAAPTQGDEQDNENDGGDAAQRLAALVQLVAMARALSRQLSAEAEALAAQIGGDPAPDALQANDDDLQASKIAAPPASPAAAEPIPSLALAKALGETAALRTRLDELTPGLAALSSRIAALEAQPLPAKAALRAVSKSADGLSSEGAAPVDEAIRRLAALPASERALALTKLSLANPIAGRF
ncbi:hypothetical protein [Methylocapsa sp. S129]|uniref:hypothetical protein n=1 Tax=Methylocapsa sp. S129 TaxID=1641869 RepID=UPI001AEDF7AC|nr:hypothetical protein [Methylocapsa sp. S129]